MFSSGAVWRSGAQWWALWATSVGLAGTLFGLSVSDSDARGRLALPPGPGFNDGTTFLRIEFPFLFLFEELPNLEHVGGRDGDDDEDGLGGGATHPESSGLRDGESPVVFDEGVHGFDVVAKVVVMVVPLLAFVLVVLTVAAGVGGVERR